MSTIHKLTLLLTGLLIWNLPTGIMAAEPPPAAVSFETWRKELRQIAARYTKGETTAQTDAACIALREEIAKTQAKRRIQISATVADVKWKESYTVIRISFDDKPKPKRSISTPLQMSRDVEFRVAMTQDEALKIKPGMRFTIDGVLTFHPDRWGAVGISTSSQQICTLRHEDFPTSWIGTFTTTKYDITIDGKPVRGSWESKE